jgi:flagella basal body P-ring formation protein FlgA
MKCTSKSTTFRSKAVRLLPALSLLFTLRAETAGLPDVQAATSQLRQSGTAAHHVLGSDEVSAAIREALGSNGTDVTIELTEAGQNLLPPGKLEFALNDALPPAAAHPENPFLWRGKVITEGGTKTVPCWVRVRVLAKRQIVRVNANYQAGQLLGLDQLGVAEAVVCPLLTAKSESVEDYTGLCLKRSVHALTPLTREMVELPPLVRRGDRVQVEAVAGQARLIFDAEAHANGRAGQSIELTNLRSGHAFRGVVSAKGTVLVTVPGR